MIINKVNCTTSFNGKFKFNNIIKKIKSSNNTYTSEMPKENNNLKEKIQKYAKKTSDFIIRFLDTL